MCELYVLTPFLRPGLNGCGFKSVVDVYLGVLFHGKICTVCVFFVRCSLCGVCVCVCVTV